MFLCVKTQAIFWKFLLVMNDFDAEKVPDVTFFGVQCSNTDKKKKII